MGSEAEGERIHLVNGSSEKCLLCAPFRPLINKLVMARNEEGRADH